ncbi:fumarylacetoacetate hydrolase family protein [Flavobacterium sp. NKUCC04_CG]|uniref:fumarylacetoacetate hydrolase family protein n=1 Tax=Flavobacterium sp. NKUCC04_CG TaxID=2842121 RepID=UPI001C5B8353|nr:fumarylacetoacetate hydrolase family protein [Flavobacterium sp. NKUCC04_CG]MBW3520240.1 fumarylacetoacetate hydrolase family protein [Flavobacterium sp. NKUCC04_CG]
MKIICIGRNYYEHISELNNDTPPEPILFLKPDTALVGKEQPFVIPDFSKEIHYEAEIVVKICKVGKYIDEKFAPRYYDLISLGIDFTARDLQTELKAKGLPWEKAKAFDNSAVVGAFLPKETWETVDDIDFAMDINQQRVQTGNSSQMLWKIDQIIAYASRFFTLKTGDLIFTGTPAGVGKVHPEDLLEGYIGTKKVFTIQVK